MKYTPDQINFKGYYRPYDYNGNIIIYEVGDVVSFKNKNYIAREVIKNKPPGSNGSGWEYFESELRFIQKDSEPRMNVGERWFDLETGRLFTKIEDMNGFHLIEL
jgi:hypothetical protein